MATDPIHSKKVRQTMPTGPALSEPSAGVEKELPSKDSSHENGAATTPTSGEQPVTLKGFEERQRPLAVTVLGVLNILLGLAGSGIAIHVWLRGAAYTLVFGDKMFTQFATATLNVCCGLSLATSIVLAVSGGGLWLVKPWARVLAIVVSLAMIVMDIAFSVVAVLVFDEPLLITLSVASMAYALLLASFLYRRHVVAAILGHDAAEEYQSKGSFLKHWLSTSPGWISSMFVHAIVLLLLGLIALPMHSKQVRQNLTSLKSEDIPEIDAPEEELAAIDVEIEVVDVMETENAADAIDITEALEEPAPAPNMDLVEFSPVEIDVGEMDTGTVGNAAVGGFGGRRGSSRQHLVASGGGNLQSEEAVAHALNWLKNHQAASGSWNFRLELGPCRGRCKDQGRLGNAQNGATAMGILPFMAAGQTHLDGKYKQVVKRGLAYLVNNMKVNRNGGSFVDGGTFYSQGLASIAICEAYAMTRDKSLLLPAQRSIAFITYAQDPVGGGWRYGVGQQGDTSVVGWQVMALKSGHMGYLNIPPNVIAGVHHFLDSVQAENGAAYGYSAPGDRPSTTAIGLLLRMYLGWEHDNPALRRGVERLSKIGPSKLDMYYNYYATQVLHHYGGEMWDRWNQQMRDYLVNSQVRNPKSHEDGSWHFNFGHSTDSGGRLYNTSLATMILEVYYRHLPLYGEEVSQDDFK